MDFHSNPPWGSGLYSEPFPEQNEFASVAVTVPSSDLQFASNLAHPSPSFNFTDHRHDQPVNSIEQPMGPVGKRRSRLRDLDWNKHKPELKRLYLDDNRTLEEIREIMRCDHFFDATSKQYKDRFEVWRWRKNLPAEVAQFMVQKANERKNSPLHKDTVFDFGGRRWTKEKAEDRVKRGRRDIVDTTIADTPDGLVYQTPSTVNATSPEITMSPNRRDGSVDAMEVITSSDEWESEDEQEPPLPLVWNGMTAKDLVSLIRNAQNCNRNGNTRSAEAMLKKAFKGCGYLHGPAHEETTKVGVSLATFYVEHERIPEAYKVIEDCTRAYIESYGMTDRRTLQLISNVAELLNGWNREADALAFLARAKEFAAKTSNGPKINQWTGQSEENTFTAQLYGDQNQQIADLVQSISGVTDPTHLESSISLARTYVLAKDEAIEELFWAVILQCDLDPMKLAIQRVQAWAGLLKLYQETGKVLSHGPQFETAKAVFDGLLANFPPYHPTRDKLNRMRIVEVLLELAGIFLKASYAEYAKDMFRRCAEKASDMFEWDSEQTIWILITVGLLYQSNIGWSAAVEWFEGAYAAALQKFGDDDGITISLAEARETHHFSYINDDGRPFRTIFGVCGLSIRPARLHLD